MIGVSKRTLENWEQGRRHPTGPVRALLRIVEADPQSALGALHRHLVQLVVIGHSVRPAVYALQVPLSHPRVP